MAVYDASGNAISLTQVHAYADRQVHKDLLSSIYDRSPFLTYLASKGGADGLGRPGSTGILSGAKMGRAAQEREAGSEAHDRIHTGAVGGGKWMSERDTSSSTGNDSQDQKVRTAVFRDAFYQQPIKIWNMTLRKAQGKYQIANAVNEAVDMATEELFEELTKQLWYGNPTDQSADTWDKPLGALQAMDTDNTYGNLDRSTHTFYAGKRSTTATAPSLNLIDDANLTQGTQHKGPGVDFCLMSAGNYKTVKQEALARGGNIVMNSIPGITKTGQEQEAVQYGRCTITYDPYLNGDDWSAYDSDVTDSSKVVAFFTTQDWVFTANKSENFRTTAFTDQSDVQGGDDATTAHINLMCRLRCRKPWRSVVYTNVG